MSVIRMERHSADNVYLHKDFHKALNFALIYLEKLHGETAVRQYLHDFAAVYYSPLTAGLKTDGLDILKSHFERIYDLEGGDISIERTSDPDCLILTIRQCPAVAYIRHDGNTISGLYHLTSEVINETICEGTPYQAELLDYNPETGACIQKFTRRILS